MAWIVNFFTLEIIHKIGPSGSGGLQIPDAVSKAKEALGKLTSQIPGGAGNLFSDKGTPISSLIDRMNDLPRGEKLHELVQNLQSGRNKAKSKAREDGNPNGIGATANDLKIGQLTDRLNKAVTFIQKKRSS